MKPLTKVGANIAMSVTLNDNFTNLLDLGYCLIISHSVNDKSYCYSTRAIGWLETLVGLSQMSVVC